MTRPPCIDSASTLTTSTTPFDSSNVIVEATCHQKELILLLNLFGPGDRHPLDQTFGRGGVLQLESRPPHSSLNQEVASASLLLLPPLSHIPSRELIQAPPLSSSLEAAPIHAYQLETCSNHRKGCTFNHSPWGVTT